MRLFFAHCILSRIKRKNPKFFRVVRIFTELEQNLTHLAHKENTQSEIFLLGRLKLHFVILGLLYVGYNGMVIKTNSRYCTFTIKIVTFSRRYARGAAWRRIWRRRHWLSLKMAAMATNARP